MKRYLLILLITLSVKAESLQTLTVLNLSSTNVAGLAWVDKHGGFHALDNTNIVTEAYVSGLLEGYQIGSTILSNFVSLGNGAGVLTNDGVGNISWVIPSSGGSDWSIFSAIQTVDMGGFDLLNVGMVGIGTASPTTYVHIQADGSISPLHFLDFLLENTDTHAALENQARMRMQCFDALVQGTVFGATSGNSGYDNLAYFINTEYGDVWLMANNGATGGTILLSKDGPIRLGGTTLDSSGAYVQTPNSISVDWDNENSGIYYCQGQAGFTGSLADAITNGKNVVGGIIVQ